MAQQSFEHDILIRVPAATVYNFLAVQMNITKIHPLVLAIEPLPDEPERTQTQFYRITDRLKLGPLTWQLKYKSAVTPTGTDELTFEAFQGLLYLRNQTRCIPEGSATRVHESVIIQTNRLLMGYAFHEAESSHAEMLVRLKDYLENEDQTGRDTYRACGWTH